MDLATYESLHEQIIERGYGSDIEWSESIKPPASPQHLFSEYGWVVVNSGMKNQIAEKIWDRIQVALRTGLSVRSAFGHPGKSAAIQQAWNDMEGVFLQFQEADDVLAWCESLPWIGPITKYHLAKNLGVNCAKPDRHLERIAKASGETVADLCARLSEASGERVATVDYVIWRAANLGVI